MNINITNHSAEIRIHKKFKNIIIQVVSYILKNEKLNGNSKYKKFASSLKLNEIQINFIFIDDRDMIGYNKKYFQRNNIHYCEYDMENTATGRQLYVEHGSGAVPIMLIGKYQLNGFSERQIETALAVLKNK